MKLPKWLSSQKYICILMEDQGSHKKGEVLQISEFVSSYRLHVKAKTIGELDTNSNEVIKIESGEVWQCPTDSLSLPINLKNLSKEIKPDFLKKLLAVKGPSKLYYRDKKFYIPEIVSLMKDINAGDSITIFQDDDNTYLAKLPEALKDLGVTVQVNQGDKYIEVDLDQVFGPTANFEMIFGYSIEATNYGNILGTKIIRIDEARHQDTVVSPGIIGTSSGSLLRTGHLVHDNGRLVEFFEEE